MLNIHMLPARFGDCLWIDYGSDADSKIILIDAGTAGTWTDLRKKLTDRVEATGKRVVIELFVVTHIDRDHIGGAVKFLAELHTLEVDVKEVWFNGWHHINGKVPPKDVLGAKDGEELSALLRASPQIAWNGRFDRRAVVVPEKDAALPVFDVAGMRITLLSPTKSKLDALIEVWMDEVARAKLIPGDAYVVKPNDVLGRIPVKTLAKRRFESDAAEANGSSIAFLAAYDGKTVLFGADAHPGILIDNLARVADPPLPKDGITALKLSHHGSKGNTNEDLVRKLGAKHYLVSTNGSVFGHPDEEAIARVLVAGPSGLELHFNYEVDTNKRWASQNEDVRDKFTFKARYGNDVQGLTLVL